MQSALELLAQFAYYFPYYVALVLIPMIARVTIERAIGIRPEVFELPTVFTPLAAQTMYSTALTVLWYPFMEELVFRGVPLMVFGPLGAILGSAVWVALHPAWQIGYLRDFPTSKKIAFMVTSTSYYIANAAFYLLMWLGGAGLTAIIYHMFHNGWIVLAEALRNMEVRPPWRRQKFIRQETSAEWAPKFVVRRSVKSIRDEVEELRGLSFVKKKS